jgi:NAD(P)H-dependent FMN reductase
MLNEPTAFPKWVDMRILTISGSIRRGSHNQRLADAASWQLAEFGADSVSIDLTDYPLPLMNVDLQNEEGIPENAVALGRLIAAADGLFVTSPEYNGSITPLLKNVIDWVSRISEIDGDAVKPWRGKVVGLGAASPGKFWGIAGAATCARDFSKCRLLGDQRANIDRQCRRRV